MWRLLSSGRDSQTSSIGQHAVGVAPYCSTAIEGKQSAPPVLLYSIAKGYQWLEQILDGKIANQCALAKRTGMTDRDINRLLRLAFIAPEIIEAILRNDLIPSSLVDFYLKRITMDWEEQKAMLGLPARYVKEDARSHPRRKL